jgi:pseudoazurin
MLNEGNQGAMIFEPAFIKINTCDSITFEMTDAGHNAVTVAGPAGSTPFDTKYKPSTTVQFDTNGLYLYKCTPHAMMAMAGLIQVSDANNKEEMISAIEKFEGTVMMPNVKTRVSDLFKANVK